MSSGSDGPARSSHRRIVSGDELGLVTSRICSVKCVSCRVRSQRQSSDSYVALWAQNTGMEGTVPTPARLPRALDRSATIRTIEATALAAYKLRACMHVPPAKASFEHAAGVRLTATAAEGTDMELSLPRMESPR